VKEIKKELELSAPLDSITLQLASADGKLFTFKGGDGNEQPVTLDSMDTLDEALKKAAKAAEEAGRPAIKDTDKLRIIVDVAAPAAPAATPAAGVDGERESSAWAGPLPRLCCEFTHLLPTLLHCFLESSPLGVQPRHSTCGSTVKMLTAERWNQP
jgi:hypothetical protein